MVHTTNNIPLPFSVWKRKLQILHGCISLFFPVKRICDPFVIGIQKLLIPAFKLLYGKILTKSPGFFRLKMSVGHLNVDFRNPFFFSPDHSVTHGLGTVDRYWHVHCLDISVSPLDLININGSVLCKDPICTALDLNDHIVVFTFFFQRNLCLIIALHTPLYLAVKPSAF